MKLKIETTAKGVEVVNFLLGNAIRMASNNEQWRKDMGLTAEDIALAERFKCVMVEALTQQN
jgi:hypothetical protein